MTTPPRDDSKPTVPSSNSSIRSIRDIPLAEVWSKSAPPDVRQAYQAGDSSGGWKTWASYLARRDGPPPLSNLVCGGKRPLEWVLPDEQTGPGETGGPTSVMLQTIHQASAGVPAEGRSAEELLGQWLSDAEGGGLDPGHALETLAWCHAAPKLAQTVPADAWWRLLDYLLRTAVEAADSPIDGPSDSPSNTAAAIQQMLGGELAVSLAYLLPELSPCRQLAADGRGVLSAGLEDLLDGEGLPHGRNLGLLRTLLGCWTRSAAMDEGLPKRCFNKAGRIQYEWLLRAALRLARRDGGQALADGADGQWSRGLFDTALRLAGDEDDYQIAALVLPGGKKSDIADIDFSSLPKASNHGEWAGVSVLRTGWARRDPRLTVVYPGRSVQLELGVGRDIVWSGVWDFEIQSAGKKIKPQSDWEEVCWVSDEDIDYLELEIALSGGLRMQRQIALARRDGFLLLADAILGSRSTRLDYTGRLPLCHGVSFEPTAEGREGFLMGRRRVGLVMPLALPEWRTEKGIGTLSTTSAGLELRQSTEGRAMFAPLFLDLNPRRMTRPMTWRRLTVAESLVIQPSDVAVGYRVRSGDDQWLIYRSLAKKSNRTLLGHNLSTEMLIARFGQDGEVDSLVEIE